jgi:hypothetical protein
LSSHTVNEPRVLSAALYCGQFVVWYRLQGVFVFIPPVSHSLSGWAEPFVQQSPKKLEEVDIRNSMFYNAEMFQKLKYYSEEFMEFNEYIYIVLGPKQGENIKFSLYYLKRQNIMITSESQVLAKKFADLLVKYDFQVKDTTPLY